MIRPAIIYVPGGQTIATLEDDPRVTDAMRRGADRYDSGMTVRVVLPGASHAMAWTHTLAEAGISA